MKKIMLLNLNTNEFDVVEVIDYINCGTYYEIEMVDGFGSVPSERVKEIK